MTHASYGEPGKKKGAKGHCQVMKTQKRKYVKGTRPTFYGSQWVYGSFPYIWGREEGWAFMHAGERLKKEAAGSNFTYEHEKKKQLAK